MTGCPIAHGYDPLNPATVLDPHSALRHIREESPATSNACMMSQDLIFSILGAQGMLWADSAPGGGEYVTVALGSFGTRIGGGTDEIQRNSIGERVLGLPREPGTE